MTEREAQEIVRMIESTWQFDLGEVGRRVWRDELREHDCELSTKAVATLPRHLEQHPHRSKPTIADLRVVVNRAAKAAAGHVTQAEILPARQTEAEWVKRWRRARAAGDYRRLPEQSEDLALEQRELGRATDADVWIQPHEYVDEPAERIGPATNKPRKGIEVPADGTMVELPADPDVQS